MTVKGDETDLYYSYSYNYFSFYYENYSVEMSFNQLKNVVFFSYFVVVKDLFFDHSGSSFLHSGFLSLWRAGPPL